MKICIVGAGAIGGILAARLAHAGHAVSVIARGTQLAAIRRSGLVLVDHGREQLRTTFWLDANADASALAERVGAQDVIFLATKANALVDVVPQIAPLMHANTMVVPAINGLPWWYFCFEGGQYDGRTIEAVDPGAQLRAALDPRHLIGCVVHMAGEVRAPGEVHHTGGRRLIYGEIDRRLAEPQSARVMALAQATCEAGLDAQVSPDIREEVWIKLIGNLSFNPVAALTGALMDTICADPDLVNVLLPMLREGVAVASAFNVRIAMRPEERIELARQLGRAKISMLQDFEAGRSPEIDAIVGSVRELAHWAGVAVPTIALVHALVQARARQLGLLKS